MEEQTDGHKAGVGVVPDSFEKVALWGFQDETGDVAMTGGQVSSEGGSDAYTVRDDLMGGDAAGSGEITPCRLDILDHPELIGVGIGAVAIAAIVECEDVDAEVVESVECWVEV